jgi:hypothetical protein
VIALVSTLLHSPILFSFLHTSAFGKLPLTYIPTAPILLARKIGRHGKSLSVPLANASEHIKNSENWWMAQESDFPVVAPGTTGRRSAPKRSSFCDAK